MTLTTALTWAFGLYMAAVTVYIVSENRRPSATFAWMLLFAVLPGAGLLLYFLFGRDMRRFGLSRTLTRQDLLRHLGPLLERLRPEHEAALRAMEAEGGAGAALARLVANSAHSTVTTRNRVEVLQNAAEAYPRLMDDLRGARDSIHLQYYSWGSKWLGEELKALLLAKVAEGVEVRILYDPVGSLLMLKRRYLRAMREAGIEMRPFSKLWRLHTISYRNHRKIAVIDGCIGHTGGLNIGHEHVRPAPGFKLWRDTNLRVVGSAASVLQAVFVVDWRNATGQDLFVPRYFPPATEEARGGDVPVQITLSGPDSQWRAIRQLYFAMIGAARERVLIQSPFFIIDASIAEALKAAALRGVDVRIMISARGTGQQLPYWAAHTYMEAIAASGATVLLYRTGYLHAKTVTTDGRVCSIGSANWDIRSFSINYELNAVVYDEATAGAVEAGFLRDMAECEPFTVEGYRARGRLVRFRDSVARLFSPLL